MTQTGCLQAISPKVAAECTTHNKVGVQLGVQNFEHYLHKNFEHYWPAKKALTNSPVAGPHSAVGNVSGYRCVSDCRSRGREFDPGPAPYFRGD